MTTSGLRAVSFVAVLLSVASLARAQLIPIKSVPIAQGDQFQLFPSHNLGMGSVSIALHDSLADPFSNPATGARVRQSRVFGSPTVYSISRDAGGGRSLPFAALARSAAWYGGLALALQQVEPSRSPDPGFRGGPVTFADPAPLPPPGSQVIAPVPGPDTRAHGNRYVFAMVGRDLSPSLSIGASAFWTGLHMLDGVDLLYAGSRRVAQDGHALDLRLGLLKEWSNDMAATRSLEAIVLHNRFSTTHVVTFAELFWDPATEQTRERARIERNLDQTNTWGLQLKYDMPLNADGWRIGWLATANLASHPKIPNYELANVPAIPRDPGYSSAYDLGVGLSKRRGAATFGVDVIYEPIRSYTWADAAGPVPTAGNDTIAAGGKTVENWFNFSNAALRVGAGRDFDMGGRPNAGGVQLGLMVRSTSYRLVQHDNVQLAERSLRARWMEWTPTWGLTLRFPELELRYRGRVTHGAGRPAQQQFVGWGRLDAVAAGTILAAPNGPLVLTDVNTTTHQISLSLPLR